MINILGIKDALWTILVQADIADSIIFAKHRLATFHCPSYPNSVTTGPNCVWPPASGDHGDSGGKMMNVLGVTYLASFCCPFPLTLYDMSLGRHCRFYGPVTFVVHPRPPDSGDHGDSTYAGWHMMNTVSLIHIYRWCIPQTLSLLLDWPCDCL